MTELSGEPRICTLNKAITPGGKMKQRYLDEKDVAERYRDSLMQRRKEDGENIRLNSNYLRSPYTYLAAGTAIASGAYIFNRSRKRNRSSVFRRAFS
jgi:hypothetical protein